MQWVVHKCLTGSFNLKRVEPLLKVTPAWDDRQHQEMRKWLLKLEQSFTVTGDWQYERDNPETKQQSSQWKGPSSPRPKKGHQAKQRSCYWRFLILRVSYTMSTLPTGKQLTRSSTWSSCDVWVNQFTKNDQKNGGMATGSCTTTMRLHTLHILCSSFWPNTAPLSCSSCHTHQISHHVTYSQGLKNFWKDTDLRQQRTSNKIRRRHY